ncbi:MAG: response regulator transcription factor [Hungatella sp.]|nr:response regulator transcription factor [Hungatella sp.]
MIRVVIADDIQILRQGLRAILSQDPQIQVIGMASNGKEAFECCKKEPPDVVLMDMRMPQYDGSWGIGAIKREFPQVKILVLTTFDDRETVDAAVNSGADGYILKEMEDEKVIQSVKMVCGGMQVFGGSVFEGIRRQMAPYKAKEEKDPGVLGLTARELDIMRCVARGMDNREIGAELFLAEGTVRNNISRLLDKLKLKDRTQLAVFTVKNHLE